MMLEDYQPILAILDEGLRLYRRHFTSFALIAALGVAPIAIVASLLAVAISWAEGTPAKLLWLVGGALLIVVTAIYLIGGLSRAAIAAAEGEPIQLSEALGIAPLRVFLISGYALAHILLTQFVYALISLGISIALAFLAMVILTASDLVNQSWLGGMFFIILLTGIYALASFCLGMPWASVIHRLQPWFHETCSFHEAKRRSDTLWRSELDDGMAGYSLAIIVLSALLLSFSFSCGLILIPLVSVLKIISPFARIILCCATVVGLTLLAPPLPIWMALRYRRVSTASDGADLAARIAEWQRLNSPPGDLHAAAIPSTMRPG
jgi:hypothetical protein